MVPLANVPCLCAQPRLLGSSWVERMFSLRVSTKPLADAELAALGAKMCSPRLTLETSE